MGVKTLRQRYVTPFLTGNILYPILGIADYCNRPSPVAPTLPGGYNAPQRPTVMSTAAGHAIPGGLRPIRPHNAPIKKGPVLSMIPTRIHAIREEYHYAWAIVGMGTALRVTANFVSQAFAVILVVLQQDFGWSVTAIVMAQVFRSMASAVLSPPAGWVGDRYGARRSLLVAATLYVVGPGALGHHRQRASTALVLGQLRAALVLRESHNPVVPVLQPHAGFGPSPCFPSTSPPP